MADTKISALAAITTLNDSDLLTAVQGGVNKKITWQSLTSAIGNVSAEVLLPRPTYSGMLISPTTFKITTDSAPFPVGTPTDTDTFTRFGFNVGLAEDVTKPGMAITWENNYIIGSDRNTEWYLSVWRNSTSLSDYRIIYAVDSDTNGPGISFRVKMFEIVDHAQRAYWTIPTDGTGATLKSKSIAIGDNNALDANGFGPNVTMGNPVVAGPVATTDANGYIVGSAAYKNAFWGGTPLIMGFKTDQIAGSAFACRAIFGVDNGGVTDVFSFNRDPSGKPEFRFSANTTIYIAEGSNQRMGVATLSSGTVVVSTTAVTATSRVFLTIQETGTATGFVRVSARTAGTSFTITSSVLTDTAVVAWHIFEPG